MTPEQERFVHKLFVTIELWLDTPRDQGGPYKGDVRHLQLFLEGLRKSPKFEEFDGASWMLIQGADNPFQFTGIELPEDLEGLTHRTAERKFLYLYFFLVKKGYELRLHSTMIRQIHHLVASSESSPSDLFIKVR